MACIWIAEGLPLTQLDLEFELQADRKAREVVEERQGAYVHPFDQAGQRFSENLGCLIRNRFIKRYRP